MMARIFLSMFAMSTIVTMVSGQEELPRVIISKVKRDDNDPTPTIGPTLPEMPDGTGCPRNSQLVETVPIPDPLAPSNFMFTCLCNPEYTCRTAKKNGLGLKCQFFNTLGMVVHSDERFLCFGKDSSTCHAELFECAGPPTTQPTPAPTPSPTPLPSTLSPTVAPTTTTVCSKNCASADNSCLSNGACTACDEPKFLSAGTVDDEPFGKCVSTVYCKRKILTGSLQGNPCKCSIKKCNYCIQKFEGETCKKCLGGYALLNNECVEECPASMAKSGISLFGRRCAEPFTCKSGKSSTDGVKCKCPTPENKAGSNCHICEFEAGEFGQKCVRCRDGKYLNKETNVCQDDCTASLVDTNVIAYKVGNYGGMCTKPFLCLEKKIVTLQGDKTEEKCKCSKEIGGNSCLACEWGFDGNKCSVCGNNQYLVKATGVCVKKCPQGLSGVGDSKQGRECK